MVMGPKSKWQVRSKWTGAQRYSLSPGPEYDNGRSGSFHLGSTGATRSWRGWREMERRAWMVCWSRGWQTRDSDSNTVIGWSESFFHLEKADRRRKPTVLERMDSLCRKFRMRYGIECCFSVYACVHDSFECIFWF